MMVVVAIAKACHSSCSDDDDNYTIGEASDGAYLYTNIVSRHICQMKTRPSLLSIWSTILLVSRV